MDLTEHLPGDHHVIREVSVGCIRLNSGQYAASLVIGARYLDTNWPVRGIADLNESVLAPLIDLEPELVVIGVGERQQLLPIEIQRLFITRGIGVECMTLSAAARTFNILMSENRRALAALILTPDP